MKKTERFRWTQASNETRALMLSTALITKSQSFASVADELASYGADALPVAFRMGGSMSENEPGFKALLRILEKRASRDGAIYERGRQAGIEEEEESTMRRLADSLGAILMGAFRPYKGKPGPSFSKRAGRRGAR